MKLPIYKDKWGKRAVWVMSLSGLAGYVARDPGLARKTEAVRAGRREKGSLPLLVVGLDRNVGGDRWNATPLSDLMGYDVDQGDAASPDGPHVELIRLAASLPGFVCAGRSASWRTWVVYRVDGIPASVQAAADLSLRVQAGLPPELRRCVSQGQGHPNRGRYLVHDPAFTWRYPEQGDTATLGTPAPVVVEMDKAEVQRIAAQVQRVGTIPCVTGDAILDSAIEWVRLSGGFQFDNALLGLAGAMKAHGVLSGETWRDIVVRGGGENRNTSVALDRVTRGIRADAGTIVQIARRYGWNPPKLPREKISIGKGIIPASQRDLC